MGLERVGRRSLRRTLSRGSVVLAILVSVFPAADSDAGFVVTDDFYLHEQWSLFNFGQEVGGSVSGTPDIDIRAPEAWSITTGDPSIMVAVLDSGVTPHPDLAHAMWRNPGEVPDNGVDDDGNGLVDDVRGWDFVDDDPDPSDVRVGELRSSDPPMAHGTAVASLIAAAHDENGMAGIAPNVTILPVRVIGGSLFDTDVAAGIEYAVSSGADVINMSFATFVPGFGFPETMEAIASAPDVLFVAGAGNSNTDADFARTEPCTAGVAHLLCVAAIDQNGERAVFEPTGGSNIGRENVHLAAPGDNMLVAQPAYENVYSSTFDDTAWDVDGWETGEELSVAGGESDAVARMRQPLDLTDRSDCWLEIRARTDLPPGGGLLLQTSADGERWSVLGGFAMVGSTGGETETTYMALNLLEGQQWSLGFLARTGAAPSLESQAAVIEKMAVTCQTDSYTGTEYAYTQGTSFSTPLVAGVAALILSEDRSLAPRDVAEAIKRSARPLESMSGVTVTGGGLDALGALLTATESSGDSDAARDREPTVAAQAAVSGALVGDLVLPELRLPVPTSRGGDPVAIDPDPSGQDPAEPGDAEAGDTEAGDDGEAIAETSETGEDGPRGWLLAGLAALAIGSVGGMAAVRSRRRRGKDVKLAGLELPTSPPLPLPWLAQQASDDAADHAAALIGLAGQPEIGEEQSRILEQDAEDIQGSLGTIKRAHGQKQGYEIELDMYDLNRLESILQGLGVRHGKPGTGSPMSDDPPFAPRRMIIRFDPATGGFSITEYSTPPSPGQILAFPS